MKSNSLLSREYTTTFSNHCDICHGNFKSMVFFNLIVGKSLAYCISCYVKTEIDEVMAI